MTDSIHPGSFRDPSGSLFLRDGQLFRTVSERYRDHYDLAVRSGLFQGLIERKLLIPHEEVGGVDVGPGVYKVVRPVRVPFISYPYEWCFSQLQDAALTTLEIQKAALEYGMSLKDASAFNIQFYEGRPILIDTLSFEKYEEGKPWVAYRQFGQHFLNPLALMSHCDIRMGHLMRAYIDGIPADLAGRLLPFKTRFNLSLLLHVHLHAGAQHRFADKPAPARKSHVSRMGLMGIIDSLEAAIRKLKWRAAGTEWADYYQDTNYTGHAFEQKKELVRQYLDRVKPKTVWDLGANLGLFSRLASAQGIPTIAFDVDPAAVEKNYLDCKKNGEKNLLPLVIDLTNPTPALGWANRERSSLLERGPADAVMALALIHHLAISNNVPFDRIADFLSRCGRHLIIEFVPKQDSQVQRLLASREDIFTEYTLEHFEKAFTAIFRIIAKEPVPESSRWLYLMEKKA